MDLDLHTLKGAQKKNTFPVGTPPKKNITEGSPPLCGCAPDAVMAGGLRNGWVQFLSHPLFLLGEWWLQGTVCSLQGQRAVVTSSSEL